MPEKEVRLIDANEILENLRCERKDTLNADTYWRGYNNGLSIAKTFVLQAPTIDPESLRPQWHDAETDPPKEPMEYIVMIKGGANATTLLYDGGLWFEEDEEGWKTYYKVTHWMSLPEPPEPYIKTTEDEE